MKKLLELAKAELENLNLQISQREQQVSQLQGELAQLNEHKRRKLDAIYEAESPTPEPVKE